MKSDRQSKILQIIAEQQIETQNQLIQALREAGCTSTQATVSRDMRELRLVKELVENGHYRYAAPPTIPAVSTKTGCGRSFGSPSARSTARRIW